MSEDEREDAQVTSTRQESRPEPCECGSDLNPAAAQALEERAWSLVPSLFQGLVEQGRTALMEVCCAPDSQLASAVQTLAGSETAASRCSLWNSCDLGTSEGLDLVLKRIEIEQPVVVWMSPPEAPYSPLQNLKSRTSEQQEELARKRLEARRVYTSCCVVFQYCIQKGIHVVWEMSERSLAWRLPLLQQLKKKFGLFEVVTKGCSVNLRDAPKGKFLQKGWRLLTTHSRVAKMLDLPCRCPKNYTHAACVGAVGSRSEQYTPEFAKRVAKCVLQELEFQEVQQESQGKTQLPELFGTGDMCFCQDLRIPNLPEQKCTVCWDRGLGCRPLEREVGQDSGSKVATQAETQGPSSELEPQRYEAGLVGDPAVEAHAGKLLKAREYSFKACESLLEGATLKSPNRTRSMVGTGAEYVTFGAYSHGAFYGATRATEENSQLVRYLNAFGRAHLPKGAKWTSISVSRDNQIPVHRDVNNSEQYPNFGIGVGKYRGGELWVHDPQLTEQSPGSLPQVRPDGATIYGRAKATRHQVVCFQPKAWHATCSWSGQRIMVTFYVSRGWQQLSSDTQDRLCDQCVEEAHVLQRTGVWKQKFKSEREREDERIKRYLYLLHAATGHGSMRHLYQALKRRNAAPRVLELAKTFTCSICDEKRRVPPQRVASLEPLPPKWATISADIGHWKHPVSGEHVAFMVIIDEGSRYRAARILSRGPKQTPSASTCLNYLMEGWTQYFGNPNCIRLDPAGSFRSQAVVDFCDRHGIFLDIVPGEAHWQIGACEQAVQGLKDVMGKLSHEEPDIKAEELLSTAVRTFNQRDMIRGFSPLQHAFGRNADVTGRLINAADGQPDEFQVENPEGEFARNVERQARAERAHSDWQAHQRILRAQDSRGRRTLVFHPGQMVFFWRSQESGKGKHAPGTKKGRFLGPARILATETRRDESGALRPGSAVWLVRGRQLVKCAPEQLRHASQREELVEALSEDTKIPWTFTKVASEIGGNQFEDATADLPDEGEWRRAQDLEEEAPPTRRRLTRKRPPQDPNEEPAAPDATSLRPAVVPRTEATAAANYVETGACWWSDVAETAWGSAAKLSEVKNFIAAEAFESLPEHLKPDKSTAIGMRWVLTWKQLDGGGRKAKARAVLLGYQDPSYEHRATTSPVMSRQTRQCFLQMCANQRWKVFKGDVSGAFLQGRPYPGDLFCIPCDEICDCMGITRGSVTRLRKACYGLVDAPLEWYKTVADYLSSLGLERAWSDPCLWLWRPQQQLRGMISGHVDDFLFGGSEQDKEWQLILQKIQNKFKWGDWESGEFTQCGVQIRQLEQGFELSQKQYVEDHIQEIPLCASRRKCRDAETSEREKTQLRAALGALSWHGQQVAPHIAAEVSLLLSEVSRSTVHTIVKTNLLVAHTRAKRDHIMKIHAFDPREELCIYAWVDAGSQNRPDGGSTQGAFLGMSTMGLQKGEVLPVSPLAWH